MRERAKALYPDIRVPELDPLHMPMKAELEETKKALEALKKEREEEKKAATEKAADEDLRSRLDRAKTSYNLTQEGFDKMVERMKATGNLGDADAAAAWVVSQNPPAPAPKHAFQPQHLDLYGSKNKQERFEKLHTDPDGYVTDVLNEFIEDPDKFVRETFGSAA